MSPSAFVPTTATPLLTKTTTTPLTTPSTPIPHATPLTHTSPAHTTTPSHRTPPAPPAHPTRILLWFHTDLRTIDNPALHLASEHASLPGGALVPLHASPTPAEHPMLAELKAHLESAGTTLLSVTGAVDAHLLDICTRLKLTAVYFNRSTHAPAVRLEARVQRVLTDAGIAVEALWGNTLLPPTDAELTASPSSTSHSRHSRNTPSVRQLTARAQTQASTLARHVAAPDSLPPLPAAAASIPGLRTLQPAMGGGTRAAVALLARMQKDEETTLLTPRADLAVLLKKHLDAGTVSPRMVAGRVYGLFGKLQGRTFSELIWRAFVAVEAHRSVGLRSAASRVAA